MAKFATNVSGAILLPSSIQVTESISGSVVPLAMFTSDSYTIDISNDTDDESLIPRTMQVPCIFTKDITIQVQ